MRINRIFLSFILIGLIGNLFSANELQVSEFNSPTKISSNNPHSSSTLTKLSFFTWGGANYEYSGDIALDSSNNSYIVGYTYSFGAKGSDICLIKFNSSGVEWNRTYGGANDDFGSAIAIDPDDNIYITGYSNSYGVGDFDIWVLKLNMLGDVEWNFTWGGIKMDRAFGITLDNQNNVYVVGNTVSFGAGSSDLCLVKFNSSGVVYNYTCGGINEDYGYGLTIDSKGSIYTVGSTKSFGAGDYDVFLVKFNSTGMVWNRTWGCVDSDKGTDIKINQFGDLLVTGYFQLPPKCLISPGYFIDHDIGLVKFNYQGEYQWNSTWKGGLWDYCFGMELDQSENVYVAGYINFDGHSNDYDICVVRFNSSGIADWSCKWGGSETELSEGIVLGPNGTILVCGYTYSYGNGLSDICLVKFIPGYCPVSSQSNINGIIPSYDMILILSLVFVVIIVLARKIKVTSKQ